MKEFQKNLRQASWNPAGDEPVHWKLAHIDPGSCVNGTNRERTSVWSEWYKPNQSRDTGSKPASKKLLGWYQKRLISQKKFAYMSNLLSCLAQRKTPREIAWPWKYRSLFICRNICSHKYVSFHIHRSFFHTRMSLFIRVSFQIYASLFIHVGLFLYM